MKLRFIQKFGAGCNVQSLSCDMDCTSRAIAMWADETNKAYALCEKHRNEMNAPEPMPGIEYAPTGALMDQWRIINGVPTYDPSTRSRYEPLRK